MTYFTHKDARIEFSRESAVLRHGILYSAFACDALHARVDFDSGGTVVVVLPNGSARKSKADWVEAVYEAARNAPHGDVVIV